MMIYDGTERQTRSTCNHMYIYVYKLRACVSNRMCVQMSPDKDGDIDLNDYDVELYIVKGCFKTFILEISFFKLLSILTYIKYRKPKLTMRI
jgi:hypothetical protein